METDNTFTCAYNGKRILYEKYKRNFIHVAYIILTILILIDIVTIIMYPEGMYSTELYTTNWFLGYKTGRVRLATMPVIMFAGI